MHIMYLTPEEQRVAIYEAVKTNDMSSLNPEAVRTYHIKDSWFKSPDICHRSSPAASIRRKAVGLFSCLPEKDGMAISQASLPDDFREVCELCMGYERDGGKLMLTDISGKELSDAYMFRYKSGDVLAHPLLFYPVSVTWTLKEIIVAGVLGFGDVIQTGTVRISKEDGKAWFRMRGNGMRCTLNPLNSEKWVCFCKTLGAMRREQKLYTNEKIYRDGDKLTLEDVEQAIKEAEMAGRNCLIKRGNIKPTISNRHLVFDSLEEAEQYYGGKIKTLEEAFKDVSKTYNRDCRLMFSI